MSATLDPRHSGRGEVKNLKVNTDQLDAFLDMFLGGAGEHYPQAGLKGRRAVCFASGSSCPPEIRGFASLGIPPGLAAPELVHKKGTFAPGVVELARLAGTGMPVFLDSGAYAEFRSGVTISDDEWQKRLDLYLHLAKVLGPQLYAVAPDKIGPDGQTETFARLQFYALRVREIAAAGAQLLMPLQPGPMALDEVLSAAEEILGLSLIPAFPMQGGRTTPEAVQSFVRAMKPEKVHLLGMGAANPGTQALQDSLWEIHPDLHINQDAMLLQSRMGTLDDPRLFLKKMEESLAFCEETHGDRSAWNESWAYTDEVGDPSSWMGPAKRAEVAEKAGYLTLEEIAAFVADPTAFLQSESDLGNGHHWEYGLLGSGIDAAWDEHVAERTGTVRRVWAIHEAFLDHPAAGQFTVPESIKRELEAQDMTAVVEWRESMQHGWAQRFLETKRALTKQEKDRKKAKRQAEKESKAEAKASKVAKASSKRKPSAPALPLERCPC